MKKLTKKVYNQYKAQLNNLFNTLSGTYKLKTETFGVNNEFKSVSYSGKDKKGHDVFLVLTLGGELINFTINNICYQIKFDQINGVEFYKTNRNRGYFKIQQKTMNKHLNELIKLFYLYIGTNKKPNLIKIAA